MSSNWDIQYVDTDEGKRNITVTSKADPSIKFTNTIRMIEGVGNMSCLTPDRYAYLDEHVKYRSDDIIVVSYPKCGTTWTEQCVLLLLTHGEKDLLDPTHKNTYIPGSNNPGKIWPEATINNVEDPALGIEFKPITIEDFNAAPARRVIKSHARAEQLIGCHGQGLTGLPEGVKVLVVSRNPLDACVSAFYHAFNPFKCGWSFEAWSSLFLTGNVTFGSFFEWVDGWFRDINNTHRGMWLQYEDMQSDPRAQILKIAAYLEIPVTEEIVDKVLLHSSFDSMKAAAAAKGGDHNDHLRKGKSGDWRNHFSPEMVAEFRQQYTQVLTGTGLVYQLGEGEAPFTA